MLSPGSEGLLKLYDMAGAGVPGLRIIETNDVSCTACRVDDGIVY